MIHYKLILGDNKPKINPPPNNNIISGDKSIASSIITIFLTYYTDLLLIFAYLET
ncbi:hypothetical protein GXM_06652 [Nostoc sphaeroides CCNUC1]|uniref:Uncharacterized protein n=1 Tax=Nostoc sphaeroides CCNUC1 TaxID=2653204 RepID=A0A5P8W8V9_9NOSO|nr:hypothetical protein GXM_06652 [Nostoc sphaeroides CCNUC1]